MSEPLFILAPPRSCTSVVCAMIGGHPELYALPETNLFAGETYADVEEIFAARPHLRHGVLRAVAELGLGGQTRENVEAAYAWLEDYADLSTAELYRDLMALIEPRAPVDKSPLHVYTPGAIERIRSAFPDARFLHLARHPRATCESMNRTRQAGGQGGGVLPEEVWLRPHLRIIEGLDGVKQDNTMFLRAEVLLADPPRYLRQIAEWLGIDAGAKAVDAMMHPERSPFAAIGPENAQLGNDPDFLESPALRPFEEPPSDLDSPLSWGGAAFGDVLKQYAMILGY
jgi:hypothetical protein